MAKKADVLFAMTGDVHRNARALRQLRALSAQGWRTTLLVLPPANLRSVLPPEVSPSYLAVTGAGGPSFFLSVHRTYLAAALQTEARLYHASDLYVLRAMRSAARRHGASLSYDARELYAHVAATEGRPVVRRFWKAFEAGPIREADQVFTVSDAIAGHLASTYGIRRPDVQYNAPVASVTGSEDFLRRTTSIPDSTCLFVHLGQMRAGRGGEAIIRASAKVDGAAVVFLGYGPEREALELLARSISAPAHFVDPVPPDRIRPVIAGADVGITLLEDSCLNHRFALPNKLFDYLAAGLPVLASRLPEMERIVTLHKVGLSVDPRSETELVEAMRQMVSNRTSDASWRANAIAAAETFDWASASQHFTARIGELVLPKNPS